MTPLVGRCIGLSVEWWSSHAMMVRGSSAEVGYVAKVCEAGGGGDAIVG